MSRVDRDVLLEALSVLTGATVKPYSGVKGSWKADDLNVYNFIAAALIGFEVLGLAGQHGPHGSPQVRSRLMNNSRLQPADIAAASSGLRKELFVDLDEFFAPEYDFDFTHVTDTSVCMRGNEPYIRPCGWNRIALKVVNKYPDGNAWLGIGGWRQDSVSGEWPVSYHGTSIEGAKGIIASNYKAGHDTTRQAYGRGIYSTYDITTAYDFSKTFTSQKTGKTYNVIMQNRINPQRRKKCSYDKYWLVEIPQGCSSVQEKEIVDRSIRPYGILLREARR